MPDDLALAPIADVLSNKVFRWNSVLNTAESEVYIRSGGTGDYEDFATLSAPGDQRVHCLRIRAGHQDIRCAGVDDGSLAPETNPLPVDTGIIRSDLPILVVGNFGICQFAAVLGGVDTTKCDLSVFRAVRGSLKVDPNNVLRQSSLLV